MALARIFTDSPEQASALIQDLERQGYQIEVLRPHDSPNGAADLEIQYELCETSEALERAEKLAAQLNADVAVESGVLRPASAGLAPEPTVQFSSEGQAVEQELPQNTWSESRVEVPELEQQVASPGIPPEEFLGEPASITMLEEAAGNSERQGPIETIPVALKPEAATSRPHPLAAAWSRGVAALVAFADNSLQTLRVLWLAALHSLRQQRERAAIRLAEARAHREQQLLELTCRRAEALQQSQQIEAARRAAAGYLSQLEREAVMAQPAEDVAHKRQTVAARKARDIFAWWMPSQHMKRIAGGAAAVGAVFALMLGISTLRGKPSSTTAVAPAPAPVVTVESNSVVQRAAPARPSPQVRKTAARLHQSTVRSAMAARSSGGEDDIGDDVVIRHFAPPKPLQSRSSAANRVKHYSDTDN
ncbi:MAG TPA: hypothetical protein VKW06_18935 [Candidatus Angelobacter sp.]|nr:hypothetical protein [Candidatus Angelobacter sp.]